MLARVKQDYLAGSVTAFSGHEYVRSEWREVPAGFEEQAKNHPLLDTQPSLKEIRATSGGLPGQGQVELPKTDAVTAVTPEPPSESDVPPSAPEAEGEPKATRKSRGKGTKE